MRHPEHLFSDHFLEPPITFDPLLWFLQMLFHPISDDLWIDSRPSIEQGLLLQNLQSLFLLALASLGFDLLKGLELLENIYVLS